MEAVSIGRDLQVEASYKQILKTALPISFAILIPQINYVTNNIFLGHYTQTAIAVAGITGVYYLIFAAIGSGLNNGLQTLISRRAGENRPGEIGKLFNQAVLVGMVIAITGIILTWTVAPYVFSLFITEPDRLEQAVTFSKIRIWGLLFLYIFQMRNALLVGTNQSRLLVSGAIAEASANVIFDFLLIQGRWGFPEMGLNGAAVASIIAEFTGMFVIFMVIRSKGISKRFQLFKNFRPNRAILTSIWNMSFPLVFQHAISIMSWEYFFLLNNAHGEIALAISNVMRNLFGMGGVITWSLAATTNMMVSNIIGQGKQEQVWGLLNKFIRLSSGLTFILLVLVNLFPRAVLSIYGQDEAFMVQAIPVLRIVSAAMLMHSVAVIFLFAVTGSGNTRVTLYVEIFAIIMYSIYVYLVLDKYFLPITYGWMSEWLYWICMFTPSYLYMRSGRWKGKVV
jgi:multidrug resistance protein, MATE family